MVKTYYDFFSVRSNSALNGGGIYVPTTSRLFSCYDTFEHNVASLQGGGIMLLGTDNYLQHSIISNNSANLGGGVFIGYTNDSAPYLLNCTFK